jgi:hypothetical protein
VEQSKQAKQKHPEKFPPHWQEWEWRLLDANAAAARCGRVDVGEYPIFMYVSLVFVSQRVHIRKKRE